MPTPAQRAVIRQKEDEFYAADDSWNAAQALSDAAGTSAEEAGKNWFLKDVPAIQQFESEKRAKLEAVRADAKAKFDSATAKKQLRNDAWQAWQKAIQDGEQTGAIERV